MKKTFSIVMIVIEFISTALLSTVQAQAPGKPVKLPPLSMMQTSGKVFKAESLPVGKPVLLIYFSPDCEHCQKLMNDFFRRPSDFINATVVMITYVPVERVAQFSNEYKVQRFPNIVVGTEGMKFFVRNYYNLMEMPFVALHDKNGNLVQSFTRDVPLHALSNRLSRLK